MAIIDNVEQKLYFDQIRNYTLALLSAFSNVKQWVNKDINGEEKTQEEVIPITFSNYEKFISLQDISTDQLTTGNYNFLPRMSISFDGMNKTPERQTNKFNKISKKYQDPDGTNKLDYSYNSLAYNIEFGLNIQVRGMTDAFRIVEQIMPHFNPTQPLEINEHPLFQEWTITQIEAQDPQFEILDEFGETDVNIINILIPLIVRGNLYSPITISGPIQSLILKTYIYEKEINDNKLAFHYRLDKNECDTAWKDPATVDKHYAPPTGEDPIQEPVVNDCPGDPSFPVKT